MSNLIQVYTDEIINPDKNGPSVTTVGTFDGVHLGHQEILRSLAASDDGNCMRTVVTFEPHPQSVKLHRPGVMPTLSSTPEKIRLLEACGADRVFILKFDEALSSLSAEAFLQEILLDRLNTKKLIVGYNHSFGKDREGNIEYLESAKDRLGFDLEVVGPHYVADETVSSTKIRKALDMGDVEKATRLLGRFYNLSGSVVQGRGVGRKLKVPTANLRLIYQEKLIPRVGVYAVAVRSGGKVFPGMLNIGTRPTFGAGAVTIEVHLIDFDGDLYDQNITLLFLKRLRDEVRFSNKETLITKMHTDREDTLEAFSEFPESTFQVDLNKI